MAQYVAVDVESDGPILGKHSMVCFGAVIVEKGLEKTFYARLAPVSDSYIPAALAISGFTRAEHETFPNPKGAMEAFAKWLSDNCKGSPVLVSDNNGYDASWINWYFHTYTGKNPFGFSSRRIGDLFCGFFKDGYYKWKKHRVTSHTHNPVDDAKGNAEAMLWLIDQGLKM